MRIISGKYRGKVIRPPKNFRARPTTDFAKEGLFNILINSFDFTELKVLDLFSGTGSIGLEFASRETDFVEMVEKNHMHYDFINKTIQNMQINNARVIKTDAFTYIDHIKQSFDIIFADPPYDMEKAETLPEIILSSEILKPGGWFIFEHSKNLEYSNHPDCFDQRAYGSVHFSFFKKPNNKNEDN